jgi:hypothetical protein
MTLKSGQDESKRAAAATELREYDVAAHPDIVPVLIDAMLNDTKVSVRSDAAESLGKIRPISQEAGWALEQALAKDSSMRVRLQARASLLSYHWSGYHSAGKEPSVTLPRDGPLVSPPSPVPATMPPKATAPAPSVVRTPVPAPSGRTGFFSSITSRIWPSTQASPQPSPRPTSQPVTNETPPPPLAEPQTPSSLPKPLPQGPPLLRPVPADSTAPLPTSTQPSGKGPELPPPPEY